MSGSPTIDRSREQFKIFTRSTAFKLELNDRAINHLVWMDHSDEETRREGKDPLDGYWHFMPAGGAASYLERRGLIRLAEAGPNGGGYYYLTKAGRLTAQLLVEAGFTCNPRTLR